MLTKVAAATQILANSMKALDSLREQAKGSSDLTLKANISTLYDSLLDLKAAVLRVEDENAELRQAIRQQTDSSPKPKIRQVGRTNYYFVADEGPYCQVCYHGKANELVMLSPKQQFTHGVGRKCEVCTKIFIEETRQPRPRMQVRMPGPWS
jgi:hypothetical protein